MWVHLKVKGMVRDLETADGTHKMLFLDRDGTLIEECEYLCDPELVTLLPGAVEGLRRFRAAGYQIVVVTNQAGIGRGYFSVENMLAVNARVRELLAGHNLVIDEIYYCPHTPADGCNCRKPNTGMAEQALAEYEGTPDSIVMIGDKAIDIEFGRRIGAKTVLVLTGYGVEELRNQRAAPDYVAASLADAAQRIGV